MRLFLLLNVVFLMLLSCSSTETGSSAGGSGRHELTSYYDDGEDTSSRSSEYRSDPSSNINDVLLSKCKKDRADACYDLGTNYFQGTETRKNYKNAGKFFFKACKLGHGRSCFVLGMMFNNAVGTKRNCKKADDFFMRGCELDNENSCVYLWECESTKEKGKFFFNDYENDRAGNEPDSSDEFNDYGEW